MYPNIFPFKNIPCRIKPKMLSTYFVERRKPSPQVLIFKGLLVLIYNKKKAIDVFFRGK